MVKRAFRLFISSTFADFATERRLLQQEVFPKLESYCVAHDFSFRAVDMRWGVNEGAQIDQQTPDLCLGEVRDAKAFPAPNLLILCGDRYGWVPLPFAIASDLFEAAIAWLSAEGDAEEASELQRVYQRDDNHWTSSGLLKSERQVVAAYTLRRREGDLADIADPLAWKDCEARLRDALQKAVENLRREGLIADDSRESFFRSLTEAEIRTGLSDAPAIAWVCTTPEAEPGAIALADFIKKSLPEDCITNGDRTSASYEADFTATIKDKLTAAIDCHISAVETRTEAARDALRAEREANSAFAAERLRVFVGRESNRAAIAAYVSDDVRQPLVLKGISGSGKSALMARAAADAEANVSAPVIKRFVGASAVTSEQRALLRSICEDLAALGVAHVPTQWEDDGNRFVAQVRDLLGAITAPVTIFIDALDQLRAPYRPAWLPHELPTGVKLVVSTLDDPVFQADPAILQGLARSHLLEIEPLGEHDGRDILAGLQRDAQRGLTEVQKDYILKSFRAAGGSPLYLKIAFAMARRWRSTDDPHARGLAEGVASLIGQFLDELSSIHHHAPHLVALTLGLIAAGRDGVSESELITVLSKDGEVMAAVSSDRFGAHTGRLPDSVWVRLRRDLDSFLVEKGSEGEPLLQFFHREVEEVARKRYYGPDKINLHRALGDFLDPTTEGAGEKATFSRRSLIELPFQLFHSGNRARLDALLTDPAWIEGKVHSFDGTFEIVEDYDRFATATEAKLIGRTLRLAAGILSRDPRQTAAQLHARLIGAGTPEVFLASLVARVPGGALYETRPALTSATSSETARLEGHSGWVTALALLPEGRLVSGSQDGTVRIWNCASGKEIARLEGHSEWVRSLAVLPDGRIASGSDDSTVRIWDSASGQEIARLQGHDGPIWTLAVLQNGLLASGSDDKTIRIWDSVSGREVVRMVGHRDWVRAMTVLPEGGLASGSFDSTIRIWNCARGQEISQLKILGGEIWALAVLPNGLLAFGQGDHTIRILDSVSGREVDRLEGAGSKIYALAALRDGRLASGQQNSVINIWDTSLRSIVASLEGHPGSVLALAMLPDGRLASASEDRTIRFWDTGAAPSAQKLRPTIVAIAALPEGRIALGLTDTTIRIWDFATSTETARLEGHSGWVTALAVLPDGRLVSGSGEAEVNDWDDPPMGGHDIRLWDTVTRTEVGRLNSDGRSIYALAMLPDGRIASGLGVDHFEAPTVHVWDPATGGETARLDGHFASISGLAALSDGRLAIASKNNTISIWDPTDRLATVKLEGNSASKDALAALPDGSLAFTSKDKSIVVWNPDKGSEVTTLRGHSDEVRALCVSADGRLVSGSLDRTIRLWDVVSAKETARLDVDGVVNTLCISSDGHVVAADNLGRIHRLAIKGLP